MKAKRSTAWQAAHIDKADELAFQIKHTLGPKLKEQGWFIDRDYPFHETRKWRIDIVIYGTQGWCLRDLAIEVEGGVYIEGRHSRGAGFEEDCEKYAELAIAGWRLIRCTPRQVKSGAALDWIRRALKL